MNIEYKETKNFTEKEIEELFLSVKWLSGKYPSRLIKALKSSSFVVTAWDGNKLVVLLSGFQKKTQKTPPEEIKRAERLMTDYYKEKEKEILE